MQRTIFDETHPFYELFVRFHANQLTREQRQTAKAALHAIHYGSFDTDRALGVAKERRDEIR